MPDFLAVRDHDTGRVLELRELTPEEDQGFEQFYAATRRKYPAPRYDVTIGGARDLDTFLRAYPRYRRAEGGGGNGGGDAGRGS